MNKPLLSTLAFAGLATFGMSASASADSTYTVAQGDTLSSIAKQFNTTVQALADANHIQDINTIYVGTTMTIKDTAGVVAKPVVAAPVATQTVTITKPVQAPAAQPEAAATQPAAVAVKPAQQVAPKPVEVAVSTPEVAPVQVAKQVQVQAPAAPVVQTNVSVAKPAPAVPAQPTGSGSVYDQFIAAGGTAGMWQHIVMPESTGNPNAISPNGYRGLGQTKEAWGTGSVAQQTKGMINYMNSRYGSEANALAFRAANGWW